MQLQPYLFFDGRCEDALEYYKKTLGAKVEMLMRFKDNPDVSQSGGCGGAEHPGLRAGSEEKVMHSSFRIGDTVVMGSDGNCGGKPSFQGFSLSLSVKDASEAERVFNALADGGQVQMPLGQTFFSPRFGMVADRFGVSWMVIVAPPAASS